MSLSLRMQGTGAVPGRTNTLAMTGEALTIGRADGNDLVLPDPERVVSSRHCVIEARGNEYYLVDISTNGTFLNYAAEPVGDVPVPVHDGDILAIGRYELRVEIAGMRRGQADPYADLPPPMGEEPLVRPRPAAVPSGTDFIAALDDPGGGGRDFLDDLLDEGPRLGVPGSGPRSGPGRAPEAEPAPLFDDDFLSAPGPDPAVRGASAANHSASPQDHFRPARVEPALIPDDWNASGASARAPEPAPAPRGRSAAPPEARAGGSPFIPDDADLGVESGAPEARPAPPPREPPRARAEPPAAPLPPAPRAEPPRAPRAELPRAPRAEPAPPAGPTPAQPPVAATGSASAARAFLKAAGVDKLELTEAELEETMARLGETFRILVTGLREVLIARASIKNEFRLGQTVISLDGNNPIKFSITPDQAIEALARPPTPGYLQAPAAARQALEDVKAHEVAMMTGMQAAIEGLLKRFDPAALAGRIEKGGVSGLFGSKKARYWEAFEALYADIAREAEDDFQALFGKEFSRAYQAQVKKL